MCACDVHVMGTGALCLHSMQDYVHVPGMRLLRPVWGKFGLPAVVLTQSRHRVFFCLSTR